MSNKVSKIKAKIQALKRKIHQIRQTCRHNDYTVIGQRHDHDGWSKTDMDIFEKRCCKDCGALFETHVDTQETYGVFYGC